MITLISTYSGFYGNVIRQVASGLVNENFRVLDNSEVDENLLLSICAVGCERFRWSGTSYRRMLDKIQPGDVKVTEHVKDHPGDNPPTNTRLQHHPSNKRIYAQPNLRPYQLTDRRQISILDSFALFTTIAKIQFWGTYEGATLLCQPL